MKMLSPLLLSPPTTSCLLPVPICCCLLLPARTYPCLLPLPATESCLADLIMPPPTSSERCQRGLVESLGGISEAWGLLGASGGLLGAFVNPLGASWSLLETAGRLWGACWGSWRPRGDFWGTSWESLGACWRPRRGLLGASSWFLNLSGPLWGRL